LARDVPLPACQRQVVNDRIVWTVTETSGPTFHPGVPTGLFRITARLTNHGTVNILQPVTLNVVTLTNGNTLHGATEGGEHAGSKQAINVGDDDALTPGEWMTVNLDVRLNTREISSCTSKAAWCQGRRSRVRLPPDSALFCSRTGHSRSLNIDRLPRTRQAQGLPN